jgi:hypothetical protein
MSGSQAIDATPIRQRKDDPYHADGTSAVAVAWSLGRNLWSCDGPVALIDGNINPSLTIQTIACRTAG